MRVRWRQVLLAVLLLPALVATVATPGAAQAPPDPSTFGAPSWVGVGTRLTLYQAAASVAESRFAWVEDPAGTWVDPKTGTHYRRTDESGEGVSTASGDGVTQVDILALDGNDIVGNISLYGIDHIHNQFVLGGTSGGRVAGGILNGAWANPDLLAQLGEQGVGGLLVLRGPYPLNGTTYDAISFANTDPSAYMSYTYDTATGILLSATTRTAGATSPIAAAGEQPPVGNTELTISRFVGLRQRTMPGLGSANPSWVASTHQLQYAGTYHWVNPVDPTSAAFDYPTSLTTTITPGGTTWAGYGADSVVTIVGPVTSHSSAVAAGAGPYWFDPATLAGFQPGQVLDEDPVTGEHDTVGSVGNGAVTIVVDLPGAHSESTYDTSSGVLTEFVLATSADGATIDLRLQGTT